MELAKKYKTLLNKNFVNMPLRLAHFFAQIHHESNLRAISENLNYSAESLRKVFGKYFPSVETANKYARNPEAIANKVYANRMGNGSEESGDGWKYRGRGFIQLTGKENYKLLSNATKTNYLENPDLLLNEADAMVAALWFWNIKNLNLYADRDDVKEVTRRINGGYNGLAHRTELLNKYKNIFK
ncbi:glycoside hydrolase family 19 protein [Terasakiella sp.]|uniref:glycoside hydrolase family 19 protein n=1 Tax=Terasakiella sp. TaxID=2034861 RepID=UPI003AA9C8CD